MRMKKTTNKQKVFACSNTKGNNTSPVLVAGAKVDDRCHPRPTELILTVPLLRALRILAAELRHVLLVGVLRIKVLTDLPVSLQLACGGLTGVNLKFTSRLRIYKLQQKCSRKLNNSWGKQT